MRRSRSTSRVLFALVLLPACVFLLPASAVEPQPTQEAAAPPPFENLQVLPKDIPRQELIDTMKGFTRALGVRCNHCHVGEGDDLRTYDFPSDAKGEKRAARVMIEMVRAINGEHLPRMHEVAHTAGHEMRHEAGHAAGHQAGHAPGHDDTHAAGHQAGHAAAPEDPHAAGGHGHAAGHAGEAAAREMTRVTCMTCHRGQPKPRLDEPPAPPAAGG
jgi:hypothetical protein